MRIFPIVILTVVSGSAGCGVPVEPAAGMDADLADAGARVDAASEDPDAELTDGRVEADAWAEGDAWLEDASSAPDAWSSGDAPDAWVMVDASTPPADASSMTDGGEPCTATGMYRIVPCVCGLGGTRSEQCRDGVWQRVTECAMVGECTPGEFETRSVEESCAVVQRVCDGRCHWDDWETVVPPGECSYPSEICYEHAFDGISRPTSNCSCRSDCTCAPVPGCPYPVGILVRGG